MQLTHAVTRRSLVAVLLTGAAAPALLGLGAGTAHADAAPGGSWVRTADLLPGSAQLQISLAPADGASGSPLVLTDGVGYGQATDYRSLTPGAYTVTVRSAGTSAAVPPLSSTYTATAGGAVTLAALGTAQAPRLAVLKDDLTTPAAGSARVRVLPAASAASSVSVSAVNGPTIASDAVFGQPTPYASVPSGAWQLRIRSTGGTSAVQPADLASGAVYTVLVVSGKAGGLQTTLLEDAAGTSVAPVGGVPTGAGGTATEFAGTDPAARTAGIGALAGLVLLVAVVGVRLRRRPLS